MKYKNIIFSTLALVMAFNTASAMGDKNNNRENLSDRSIVFPSGVDANTKEMATNWYLKNYTNLNESNLNEKGGRLASDRNYEDRLEKLSKRLGIDMPFNPVVKSYIERYVDRNRSQVAQMLGLWNYYRPIFEKEIRNHKLPDALKYIPVACSALNPNAVAPSGAAGLWQFMVLPAKGNGLEVNTLVDERRDPIKSTEKAAIFLEKLHGSYQDWLLVVAAFHCGMGNVEKAIRRAQNNNIEKPDFWDIYKYLPKETRGYVPAFIAACYVMNYYKEHDITPVFTKKPLSTGTATVNKRVSIHQISQVLNIPLEEIRLLNPQYRDDVIPGNIHSYLLTLPKGQINSYRMTEDKIVDYHKNEFARRVEVQPGDIKSIVGDDEMDEYTKKGISFHTVTEGEDLEDIAGRYGMDIDDLMELNNLRSAHVETGKVLTIKRKGGNYNETVMNNRRNTSNNSSYSSNNDYAYNNNNSSNDYSSNNSGHYGSDNRNVPQRQSKDESQSYVPQPQKNNNDYNEQDSQDKIRRQQEAEAAKKRREAEAAAKKKRDQEIAAAKKKKEQEAAALAAKKKKEQEAAALAAKKKHEQEEAARRKAAEEAAKPIVYEVKEGNNLTKLAEQYGVTIADIKAANPNLKDENIKIGQKLNIPKKGHNVAAQAKQSGKQTAQPVNDKPVNTKQNDKQSAKDKKAKAAEEAKRKAAEEAKRKAAEEAKKPINHVVKEGNNLTKLAEQYGVSIAEIKAANPTLKDENIKIGQKLIIPKKGAQQQPQAQPKQGKQSKQAAQPAKNNNAVAPTTKKSGKKK
jgi:membrane-bound lytic murein transglycosylase D